MHWEALISGIFGSTVAGGLIKYFIMKSIESLQELVKEISNIKTELAQIAVKLDLAERDRVMLFDHDRKIAGLEAEIYKRKH